MSANGLRVVALNGLAILAAAMLLAGVPVILVVWRDVYHTPMPVPLPGDYRAWLMAHMVGLTSGLVIIAIAQVTRLKPMAIPAERRLILALVVSGWGNTIGSIAAPVLGVRGVGLNADLANDAVAGMFGLSLVTIVYALGVAIAHLARPIET